MVILTVDPAAAKPQAWAMLDTDDFTSIQYGLCDVAGLRTKMRSVHRIYCEGQYVGKNADTALELSLWAGRIWQMAEEEGFHRKVDKKDEAPETFFFVKPRQWMTILRCGIYARSDVIARHTMEFARRLVNVSTGSWPVALSQDEASTICIGVWAVGEVNRQKVMA